MYSETPISLASRGLYCIGPQLTNNKDFVQELCPYNVRLDLDTAHFIHAEPIRINPRCVVCSAKLELSRFEGKHDLLPGCADTLRGLLAESAETPWKVDESELFAKVLRSSDQLKKGETPEQQVICLDLEYSSATRKVFEIGVVDYYSGEVLCDVKAKHNLGTALHHARPGIDLPLTKRIISLRTYEKVNMGLNAGKSPSLDVHQIANLLRSIITPEAIVLVWASNRLDLQLLRGFLATAGYGDFLPPDENCIPVVTLVRKKLHQTQISEKWLPLQKSMKDNIAKFPLSLPILFPLIFVGHELIGRNHRAIVDSLQLRLMVQYIENNCRTSENRHKDLFKYRR